LAGRDITGIPFPVMQPDEVVAASLAGLRLGEVVCVPALPDPSMVGNVDRAEVALYRSAVISGLADRYRSEKAGAAAAD